MENERKVSRAQDVYKCIYKNQEKVLLLRMSNGMRIKHMNPL